MLKEFIDSLKALVDEVAAKPLGAILAVILIMAAYFAFTTSIKIDRLNNLAPTANIEQQRFERALDANNQINIAMEETREKLGASRILVKQFHNGRADLTGIPFTSITTTFISSKEGFGLSDSAYDTRPLSTMNNTLREIWKSHDKPHCVVKSVKSVRDYELKNLLESRGVNKVAYCPMTNLLNYPVGVISLGYVQTENTPSDQVIMQEMQKLSDKIVGFLGQIEEQKDTGFFSWFIN